MLGGKNKQPLGYTIVEVMVVLAISGVMFLIAANFINGKESRSAFTAGVNEMASQIQDVIEQVGDGRYSDVPLDCTGGVPIARLGGTRQGTNTGCIFMGKVVHFQDNSKYELISIAANRKDPTTDNLITSPLDHGASPAYIDGLTTQASIPQQLTLPHPITFDGTQNGYGLGLLPAQNAVNDVSNTQTVGLYYVNGMVQNSAPNIIDSGSLRAAKTASICLTDGTRYAEIKLGDKATNQSGQLSASVQVDDTPC